MSRCFSVLLPITRPPILLPFAIESVLDQNLSDFELLVICDGAPPETAACATAYAERDTRVKVYVFPKGVRHGEEYRHRVLAEASGRNIVHTSDDDLWLPNHLEEMERLLSVVDFGNLLQVHVRPNGAVEIALGDLGLEEIRQRMMNDRYNFFGLSVAGYRLEAYRQLPEGWAAAPPDIWTDLFMWRKFLAVDGATFGTRAAVTALHFATPERHDATLEERRNESSEFLKRIRDPFSRNEIVEAAWHSLLARALESADVTANFLAEQIQMKLAIDNLQADNARLSTSRSALRQKLTQARISRERLKNSQGTLKTKIKRARRRLKHKENVMRRSRSWRLSVPLRKLAARLSNAFRERRRVGAD
jgi:glycosyltransferase involved in cell wall biosynthesis